jgi:hypothetical protein
MKFWREMPPTMFLKSRCFDKHLHSRHQFTFSKYSKNRGLEPVEPCAIAHFARYGAIVQRQILPQVEPIEVIHVAGAAGGFEITLSNWEKVIAARLVVATGLKTFARMPRELLGLSPGLASHTCDHLTFDHFDRSLCAWRRPVSLAGSGALA